MTTIHIQIDAEDVPEEERTSAIYKFAEEIDAQLRAFADTHPDFRFALVVGDAKTEAMGAMGNMSPSLARYGVGLYKRAKDREGT